jgi:hypothetical protein
METARYIKANSGTPTKDFCKKKYRNTLLDAVNFQVHPILFEVALQDEAAAPPVQTEDQVKERVMDERDMSLEDVRKTC